LHSDVHRDESRGEGETQAEKERGGWMDARRKSEKRADKYKFLVFFRQLGYGGVKPPLRGAF